APIQQRGAHALVQNPVLVVTRACAVARMKFGADAGCPPHGNLWRQEAIDATHPGTLRALPIDFKMHYLSAGVHTRVGAPGADRGNTLVRKAGDGAFEHVLYG